jgi:DNA adenine methylase
LPKAAQKGLDVATVPVAQAKRTPLKPPLKWAGGKRWLVPYLREYWKEHRHRRLVEPFVGGLAVTLGLLPENALLNDINPYLISFYRWLQQGLHVTIETKNDEELYYRHRDRFNELITSGHWDGEEASQLFLFLNRTSYNGLCRFNKKGTFNVPFGRYKTINYPRDLCAYRDVLAPWSFTRTPFEQIELQPDDFVYADPPYDVEFTQYSPERFGWEEQKRLAQWLTAHPGPVILSNQATPRIIELYDDLGYDTSLRLQAPRMISCTGDRSRAEEVVATRGFGLGSGPRLAGLLPTSAGLSQPARLRAT